MAPGFEDGVRALLAALARTPFPGPPPGFGPLTPPRPMRAVLAGLLEGPGGPVPVVLKWHRPAGLGDRLARLVRAGRGVREARALGRAAAAGLPVPEVLAAADGAQDVLVTRRLAAPVPLPTAQAAPRALVTAVAGLLARLHGAGLAHRDLTRANLALVDGAPHLIDLGGARCVRPTPARRRAHLVQAAHGLLHGASRAQRARALRAWLSAAGEPAEAWRPTARAVERGLAARRRRHHRRRERTLAEPGRRFAPFERRPEGVRGLRLSPAAPEGWEDAAAGWIAAAPPGAEPLAGSARVVRARLPGRLEPVVVKRFPPTAPGRRPRAFTALLRAAGLEERGLPAATPLLAATGPGGSVLVSAALPGPTLWEALRPGGAAAAWSGAGRRRLLEDLGRALRRLHDAEVSHRDLKPLNLLVLGTPEEGFRLAVVDLEGARLRYRPVSVGRRARDLARLAAGLPLPAASRLRVLAAYARAGTGPGPRLRPLAERVHALAERQRVRLRTRYGPAAVEPWAAAGPDGPGRG